MSESTLQDVEYITEQNEDGKKNYKIKGIFMQADIKNKNGRVYPMEILQKEVNRYNKEFINEKRAYGELGHPEGPTVNLERASHMITALYPDGKNFIGEAKILSTPMGEIVKTLMDEGAKLGVSSRGMGSLEEKDGKSYVRNDFYLATAADIVSDPSAPSAFAKFFHNLGWSPSLFSSSCKFSKRILLFSMSSQIECVALIYLGNAFTC